MKIVLPWLSEMVSVPSDAEKVAREISLRGFEVASVETRGLPAIDFEITANRPDCLNHLGIAREAATIWAHPLQQPEALVVAAPPSGPPAPLLDVRLEDEALCPRYCAQVFEVTIGPSPRWLAERLEAAGVRPISNVVDVTNYVMLEIGQPMHAFDLDRLDGKSLVIRRARPGERLTTLDGVDRALDSEMLVIADASRASAIGGVMGGGDSEIGAGTTRIALESACFHPASVRRTSKRLGLKTEASIRFERGGDIAAPPTGIGARLRSSGRSAPASAVGGLIDRYPTPRADTRVALRSARIGRVLGMDVPQDDVARILTRARLRCGVGRTSSAARWSIGRSELPRRCDARDRPHRRSRAALRIRPSAGHVPGALDAASGARQPDRDGPQPPAGTAAAGFSESVTFAFIERQAARPFCAPGVEPAAIANPLSEKFAVLRPSLLRGSRRRVRPQPSPGTARRPGVRNRQPLHRGWRRARGRVRVVRRGGGAALVRTDSHRGLLRREGRHRSARRCVGLAVEFRPSSDRFSHPDEPRKLA